MSGSFTRPGSIPFANFTDDFSRSNLPAASTRPRDFQLLSFTDPARSCPLEKSSPRSPAALTLTWLTQTIPRCCARRLRNRWRRLRRCTWRCILKTMTDCRDCCRFWLKSNQDVALWLIYPAKEYYQGGTPIAEMLAIARRRLVRPICSRYEHRFYFLSAEHPADGRYRRRFLRGHAASACLRQPVDDGNARSAGAGAANRAQTGGDYTGDGQPNYPQATPKPVCQWGCRAFTAW